ncbi:MAG: pyridoxamine 5'-phosphate oxidase [Akkermansiaceae bacterium]|nr:pyridoxamine 5'-phosphate oxidase [Akkermansiaceae bacterium]MCP5550044.1 pyridoxamine 5'-phosphate oxidase [Akkermansiaceae bacterium]
MSPSTDLSHLREEYRRADLDETDVAGDPIEQFRQWFDEARAAGVREANAMIVSTADAEGRPASRTLLLKGFGAAGFDFFTNHESRKGEHLAVNPRAAITFFWPELERQVNLRGPVERLPRDEAERYFPQRPYGSRIGAWVSRQSREIPNREWLEARDAEYRGKFPDTGSPDDVPLPDYWGGYRLAPESVEFWQGRPSRLHDRVEYVQTDGTWRVRRLSP